VDLNLALILEKFLTLLSATYCNTLQHAATRCNTLQHTATRHTTVDLNLALFLEKYLTFRGSLPLLYPLFSPPPDHPALGTLGSKVSNESSIKDGAVMSDRQLRKVALEEDLQVSLSLRHTATHCNTLQHTATHCSTL